MTIRVESLSAALTIGTDVHLQQPEVGVSPGLDFDQAWRVGGLRGARPDDAAWVALARAQLGTGLVYVVRWEPFTWVPSRPAGTSASGAGPVTGSQTVILDAATGERLMHNLRGADS